MVLHIGSEDHRQELPESVGQDVAFVAHQLSGAHRRQSVDRLEQAQIAWVTQVIAPMLLAGDIILRGMSLHLLAKHGSITIL